MAHWPHLGARGDLHDVELSEVEASTARPPFEPGDLAARLDASAQRVTQPPGPGFEVLRDSCRSLRIVDLALEEIDVGWGDSDAKR
jgi:hypothetical protein